MLHDSESHYSILYYAVGKLRRPLPPRWNRRDVTAKGGFDRCHSVVSNWWYEVCLVPLVLHGSKAPWMSLYVDWERRMRPVTMGQNRRDVTVVMVLDWRWDRSTKGKGGVWNVNSCSSTWLWPWMLQSNDTNEMGWLNTGKILCETSWKPAFTLLGAKWAQDRAAKSLFCVKTSQNLHHTLYTS